MGEVIGEVQASVVATVIVVMTLGCDDGDDCNDSGDLYWCGEVCAVLLVRWFWWRW